MTASEYQIVEKPGPLLRLKLMKKSIMPAEYEFSVSSLLVFIAVYLFRVSLLILCILGDKAATLRAGSCGSSALSRVLLPIAIINC